MERLTKKSVGVFNYALKDHKATVGEFGTYDAFFDYSIAVKKLGEYEDAEEQGLLIRLPCKVGSHVWRVWITDGRKPEITEHDMSDLLHIVQWIGKFGISVFLTREEAEAAISKDTNVYSKGENNED